MQETTGADLRQLEAVLKDAEDSVRAEADHVVNNPEKDSASALQLFLDRIPINSSIPGIKNAPGIDIYRVVLFQKKRFENLKTNLVSFDSRMLSKVFVSFFLSHFYSQVELKTGDSVKDAIELLYTKNAFGAPIADVLDPDITIGRFPDRYIGFLDFATVVLWSLEQCEKARVPADGHASLLSLLEQNPEIGQTKVGELAKSFLWNPFFPVRLEDTLFHVLLLLSKHRVQVVPVVEQPGLQVIGFVTQNAVIQLLLQSDGLAWFDGIAEKSLLEFRFENESLSFVYGDESIAEALHILFKSQIGAIAVIDRQTQRLMGSVRSSDVYLLMENDNLFHDRGIVIAEEFIHMETSNPDSDDPTIERDIGALLSAGVLHLRNKHLPRMDLPVTNKKTDTLKQAMKNVAETKSNFIFQVDDLQRPLGILTLRDIILQFAPPCMNSNIEGGCFFESALEQTGCQIKGGTLVCDH